MIHPSVIDRIYYAIVSQRNGLQSVSYYTSEDWLSYEFEENAWSYSLNLTFKNHGNKPIKFYVKLVPESSVPYPEAIIKDDAGEIKVFALSPNQIISYHCEFTDYIQTTPHSGSGSGGFSIVLLNEHEQYAPKPIVR